MRRGVLTSSLEVSKYRIFPRFLDPRRRKQCVLLKTGDPITKCYGIISQPHCYENIKNSLLFRSNNGYTNVLPCQVIRTLSVLLYWGPYKTHEASLWAERRIPECENKKGTVRVTQHRCGFAKPLLTWESYKYYILSVFICVLILVIWHADRMFSAPYYIVICGLSGSTTFFHIIS
jgi:hypothetical protein